MLPDPADPELLERQSWLREHVECSVTELEIVHGVLNDPKKSDQAYFYFRDSAYLNHLEPDRRADFICESPAAAAKLAALKNRIRAAYLAGGLAQAPRENY
jgi:nephrocystin-3